jgi:hypothetical protein
MKKLKVIVTAVFVLGGFLSFSQLGSGLINKIAERNKEKVDPITFYKDEALNEGMQAINDGDTKFYVKVPLSKNKVLNGGGSYSENKNATIVIKSNGYEIYRKDKELDESLISIAKRGGYILFKVDLEDEEADLQGFLRGSSAEESKLPLEVYLEAVMYKRVAEGSFFMDLSQGKSKYMNLLLSDQSNYQFKYEDKFKDDEHKKLAIEFLESSRVGVGIGEFAWYFSDQESYENEIYYQRYMAKITYMSEEEQCFEAAVEYWKSKPLRANKYALESVTLMTGNAIMIPCDRAGM